MSPCLSPVHNPSCLGCRAQCASRASAMSTYSCLSSTPTISSHPASIAAIISLPLPANGTRMRRGAYSGGGSSSVASQRQRAMGFTVGWGLRAGWIRALTGTGPLPSLRSITFTTSRPCVDLSFSSNAGSKNFLKCAGMCSICQRLPLAKSPPLCYNCAMPIKTFTCQYCGKTFQVEWKRSKPKMYCSRECWRLARSGKNAPQYKRIIVTCDFCGKTFEQPRYLVQPGKGNYCSRACAARDTAEQRAKERENGRMVPCANCGKMIYRHRSRIRKANFCSPQCLGEYRKRKRVTIICANCGRKKRVKPSYYHKGVKYCSLRCMIQGTDETKLETLGYALLEVMGFEFRKQYKVGRFIPDAFIPSLNMAVLFDGDYWHSKPDHKERDARFNSYAAKNGFLVVRVLGSELKQDYNILRERIIQKAQLQPFEVPPIPKTFVPPINHGANVQLPLDLGHVLP